MIAAVAAIDKAYAIGNAGNMLISIPEDLKMFRELTMGQVVIMGRKTFDALPHGVLPGRVNVVISTRAKNGFYKERDNNGTEYYVTCMELVKNWLSHEAPQHRLHHFIIGGGVIYKELLPFCDRMYLTHIDKQFSCADTFFPQFAQDEWNMSECSEKMKSKDVAYCFCVYDRRKIKDGTV